MRIQLIESPTPNTYRLEIEAPWETVAPDYADACAAYRGVALPGFRSGHVPPEIIAQKFAREICADAAQRCAVRLTRDAIREKQLRTAGGIAITEAIFVPNEPFHCTAELTRRPDIILPDYHSFIPVTSIDDLDSRRDEISSWLLSHTRFSYEPVVAGSATDSPHIEADSEETRLVFIAREIAEHDGITLDESHFEARLADMAAQASVPVETYRANLDQAGALESFREFLLVEAVLDYLAARQGDFVPAH